MSDNKSKKQNQDKKKRGERFVDKGGDASKTFKPDKKD